MKDTCGICSPFVEMAMHLDPETPVDNAAKPDVISNMDAVDSEAVPTIRPQSPALQSIPETENEGKSSDEADQTRKLTVETGTPEPTEKTAQRDDDYDEDEDEKALAVESLVASIKVESTDTPEEKDAETKIGNPVPEGETAEETSEPAEKRDAEETNLDALQPSTAVAAKDNLPKDQEERDFDKNPTDLYCAIQKKDWETAQTVLQEAPSEARAWILRRESSGKLRWRLLPIHAAIIFNAPKDIVETLLDVFPEGTKAKDDQGMLPLHLSFRIGSSEDVVAVLLEAFPDSVNVQDRKGRTPVTLAETSTGPNKDAFLRAIQKDIRKRLVAASSVDFSEAPTMEERTVVEETATEAATNEQLNEAKEQKTFVEVEEAKEKDDMKAEQVATQPSFTSKEAEFQSEVSTLKATLARNQETSKVLVDHIASLEAQLAKSMETDSYHAANKVIALGGARKNNDAELSKLNLRIKELESENEALQSEKDTATKALADSVKNFDAQKTTWSELKKKNDVSIAQLEGDCRNLRADVVVLEEQIKLRTASEKALASQVATLANQLLSASDESGSSTAAFTQRIRGLEKEREELRFSVDKLSKKLYAVTTTLNTMGKKQADIVEQALAHESQSAMAACSHADVLQQVKEQAEAVEKAKADRERILQLLNNHVEQLEKVKDARSSVLAAVEEQAQQLSKTSENRLDFIKGVTGLKEQMGSVLNSVYAELPTDMPEDDTLVDRVVAKIMSGDEDDVAEPADNGGDDDAQEPTPAAAATAEEEETDSAQAAVQPEDETEPVSEDGKEEEESSPEDEPEVTKAEEKSDATRPSSEQEEQPLLVVEEKKEDFAS